MSDRRFDFLVLGSGIAGLSFALKVAPRGRGPAPLYVGSAPLVGREDELDTLRQLRTRAAAGDTQVALVAAYADPWSARAGRWARRHRTVVVAAGVLLTSAVVALAISTGTQSDESL